MILHRKGKGEREKKNIYIYICVRKKERKKERRNRTEGKREWRGGDEGETVRGYASAVKSSRTKSTNKS